MILRLFLDENGDGAPASPVSQSMSKLDPKSGNTRRWLQGCAFAIIACFATCYACTKSDPWQRLFGSLLAEGTNSLTVRGAMNFDWPDKSVLLSRISSSSGPDGYAIEVLGDSGLTKFFTFTTRFRPEPGSYRLVGRYSDERPGAQYTASLDINGHEPNSVNVGFSADSGRLTITRVGRGLDGSYTVFMGGIPSGEARVRRHIVVEGRFHLEP